jgi:uncharacterized protein YdhG (YjbR/CyaY superfamily)
VNPAGKPRTIDQYLARVGGDLRAALERLRKTMKAAAPKAEECLRSTSTVEADATELEGYESSTGTIRFQPDKPLPATLVRKLVRASLAENDG